jgi:hypothetical protein
LDDCSAQVFPYNIFAYCSICRVDCKFARNKKKEGIWMIHIVEGIELLLLLSNRLFMTSLLTIVGQAYPGKHIRNNARYLVTKDVK